jgi:hypothetical protein
MLSMHVNTVVTRCADHHIGEQIRKVDAIKGKPKRKKGSKADVAGAKVEEARGHCKVLDVLGFGAQPVRLRSRIHVPCSRTEVERRFISPEIAFPLEVKKYEYCGRALTSPYLYEYS